MRVSISKAWDETLAFVGRERNLITPIVLALLVVPAVIIGLIQPTTVPGAQPEPGTWIAVALVAVLVSLIGQLAIMRLALGWDGKVADALRLAVRRIWVVLAASIILGVVVVLAALPFALIAGFDGDLNTEMTPTAALLILFLMIAFLAVVVRFVPLSALAIEGQDGPWSLLKRSWTLTAGSYWRLLAFLLLFGVVTLVVGWAVQLIAGIPVKLLLGPSDPMTVSRLLISLADGLVQGLIGTVYAIMVARIAAQLVGNPSKGI